MRTNHQHDDTDSDFFTPESPGGRVDLIRRIADRLRAGDAQRLTTAEPAELIELLGAAGLTPSTIVAALAADRVDTITVASLLPTIGVPTADGIRALHDLWDVPNTIAAELLDATADEMRAAGCTAAEIIAARPTDILRELPADPRQWELAAGAMATAGHTTDVIVDHLVAHAPTQDAFTAGLFTVVEPDDAPAVAARRQATPEQLSAASEAAGLSPTATALALAAHATNETILNVISSRCDQDRIVAAEIAAAAGIDQTAVAEWMRPTTTNVTAMSSTIDIEISALLERLPAPGPSRVDDPIRGLDALAINHQ
jgi:hypothetical protein